MALRAGHVCPHTSTSRPEAAAKVPNSVNDAPPRAEKRVLRALHLFSGRPRPGDLSYALEHAVPEPFQVQVDNIDIERVGLARRECS